MPATVSPNLPPAVVDAVAALGHPARAAILGYLRDHTARTLGEIAGDLTLGAKTVQYHLGILTELGAITADPPAAIARSGQRTRYALDEERVRQLLTALARHVGAARPSA